jgi:hypothetical protein
VVVERDKGMSEEKITTSEFKKKESVKALIKEFLSNESRNVEKGVILNFLNNINEFLIEEIKVHFAKKQQLNSLYFHLSHRPLLLKLSLNLIFVFQAF